MELVSHIGYNDLVLGEKKERDKNIQALSRGVIEMKLGRVLCTTAMRYCGRAKEQERKDRWSTVMSREKLYISTRME